MVLRTSLGLIVDLDPSFGPGQYSVFVCVVEAERTDTQQKKKKRDYKAEQSITGHIRLSAL